MRCFNSRMLPGQLYRSSSVKMRVLRTLSFNPGGKKIGALDRNYDAN